MGDHECDGKHRNKGLKIHVFDNEGITFDRYTVLIGNYVFYMSRDADRANHVNICAKRLEYSEQNFIKLMEYCKFTQCKKIPKSIKIAVRERCKQIRSEQDEEL